MEEIRPIDANALRKAFKNHPLCNDVWLQYSRELIDNAPTIEITEEQAIDKLHETGWLQEHDKEMTERPKGNWIKWNFKTFGPMGDWEYKCDRCEKVYGGEYNFCPNCGADMQKGDTPNG